MKLIKPTIIFFVCLMLAPIVLADSIPLNYTIKMWTTNTTDGNGAVHYDFDNGRATGQILCDGKTYPSDSPYIDTTQFVRNINCENGTVTEGTGTQNFTEQFGEFTNDFNITLDKVLGECRQTEMEYENCKVSKDHIWNLYTNASNETNVAWPALLQDCQNKLASSQCPVCDCSAQIQKNQDNTIMYCLVSAVAGAGLMYFFMKRDKPEQPASRLPTRGY